MFVTSHPYYETMEVFSNNSTVTIILIFTQQTQNICITFVQRRPKVLLMHTDTYYQK